MFKKIIFLGLLFSLSTIILTTPLQLVFAQTPTSIIDTSASTSLGAKYKNGDYGLNDIMAIAINASKYILGIVGSLTLIMFIYGGVIFLISAGNPDTVGQAKKILTAAVIGLIIVFASYIIIKLVIGSLGLNWNGGSISTPPAVITDTAK